MSPGRRPLAQESPQEVSALIRTLHETEQRLEALTGGEVDSVADHEGRTFLLRRAQEQLRHHEAAKQAAILDALPAHIALLDADGVIISVNGTWQGFPCAEAIQGPGHAVGLNYVEVCESAQGEGAAGAHQVAAGVRSVLGGAALTYSVEFPCNSPTGERWFLMSATPIAPGRAGGAVVMQVDLSAERLAQESLLASELRFREMADNIGDVFYLRDADGKRMLYVSPAYEAIWGRSCESLYANAASWGEAVHPDDRAATREKNRQGVLAGQYQFEYRIVRPDGAIRWIETTGYPVRDEAGNIIRIAGIAKDITQIKQARQKLGESELRFRQLADSISDVFFLHNLDRSRIYYVSAAYEHIWGRTCESLYARPASWAESIHPDDLAQALAAFSPGRASGSDHELRILRPDGEVRWIHLRGFPVLDDAGKPYRTAGVASDVTERKLAEEVLGKRAAELERFHRLSVGRELQMVELKKQVNALAQQAGQPAPYDLAFLGPTP